MDRPSVGRPVNSRGYRLAKELVVDPVQVGRSATRLEELPRCGESILFGHQRPAPELRVPVAELISDLSLVVPAATATGRTGQSVLVDERGLVGPKPDPQLRRLV